MKYSKEARRLARQVLVEECSKQRNNQGSCGENQVNSRRMVSEVSWGVQTKEGPHGPLDTLRFGAEWVGHSRAQISQLHRPLCPLGGKEHKKKEGGKETRWEAVALM